MLCNNAGVSTFNLLRDQTLDDWRWVFGVNLWGVVHGLQSFVPIMRSQGTPGHIVNTASIAGLLSGVSFIGPYSATKVAVVSISETLAQELAVDQSPIGVSVLCPSSVDTRVMESERGRPAELGVEHRTEVAESVRLAIRASFTGPTGLTPAAVAVRTLDAIRGGALLDHHPQRRAADGGGAFCRCTCQLPLNHPVYLCRVSREMTLVRSGLVFTEGYGLPETSRRHGDRGFRRPRVVHSVT